jgi:gluconate 5-dehydrogenase
VSSQSPIIERLFSLEGQTALVTGGNSGIGLAIAEALAQAGASVVLAARRKHDLEEAAARIAAAGGTARWVACDLAERDEIAQCVERASSFFGTPDILVNAAGVNFRQPIDDVSEAAWDATIAVNLAAPFFLSRSLSPTMIRKGRGRIINIASLQSVRAFSDGAPYGASKGGVMQLTRAQAQAWSRYGITCNAIAPGFFPTPLTAQVFGDPQRAQAMAAHTMIGRNGELEDLHGVALFLASRASDYVTGQTLFVDGGFTAG